MLTYFIPVISMYNYIKFIKNNNTENKIYLRLLLDQLVQVGPIASAAPITLSKSTKISAVFSFGRLLIKINAFVVPGKVVVVV